LDSANWAGANVVVDPQTPLIAVVNTPQPGVFDYVFSVTDNFGCTYDTTMTVTVTPSPQAPIIITGDEVICEDGIAYLVAPSGFDSYLWNPGNATGTNVNVQAGTYTVTVAFGNCPLTSDPFTVSLAPDPVPIITGPQFSCGGVPVTLTTEDEYVSYNWSNNSQSPSVSVGSGNWFVTVTNEFGCSGTSASYPVTVAQDPVAAFGTNPLSPQPVTTTVNFNDASSASGGNIETWFWDFDDEENTSSAQNPSYTFNDPGTYDVLLVVTTADGCIDSTIVSYVIFPPDILIPNVFTPNGDDLNETFSIENLEFYQHELRIYSRWGTLVHESTNANRPWRAGDQPDGTYYYVLTLEDGRELAGHVTVLR
jgi:gliding motility-associated-like protein